jgi:hypothetical protein
VIQQSFSKNFDVCLQSEASQSCFEQITDKPLVNYLYETIEYPGGAGGYQPINGVGVSVADFDYVVEVEVDLFTGVYPVKMNEDIQLLSTYGIVDVVKNSKLTWWKKEFIVWHKENDQIKNGRPLTFVSATWSYVYLVIALLGWVILIKKIFLRITPKH